MQDNYELLMKYAKAYEDGKPMVSDEEFDRLHREYKDKGGEPITMTQGGTLKHQTPMSSMSDTFTLEEALIVSQRQPYLNNRFIVEPKWDGVSGSFTYVDGILIQGLTRGDGIKGNLIPNFDEIINLPSTIPTANKVIVRGELVIARNNFDYDKFSNPRNTVAGVIRKNIKGAIKKLMVEFIPWDVIFDGITKHSDIPLWLECNGFRVLNYGLTDIESSYHKLSSSRDTIPYDMDGVVIKIDDKRVANKLGMGSKYSNYMYALKFKDVEYTSTVVHVSWQMGMTGTYTPVIQIKPTLVNGVIIGFITMHNISQLKNAKCGVGSEIRFIRSGDVIPKYIGTIKESMDFNIPKHCLHCNSKLKIDKGNIRQLVCEHEECIEKDILKLVHFTKRGYLDILGLSKESISKLYPKYLKSYPDIFKTTKEQYVEVLGKNGSKIYNNIQKTKGISLNLLLGSIPIPNGGRAVFKLINIDMSYEEMLAVKGIGKETARDVSTYLSENKDMIDELIRLVKPTSEAKTTVTYGISGTVPGGRAELIKKLEKIGWRKTSGKADYFIAGDGALLNKAKGKIIKVEDIPWKG